MFGMRKSVNMITDDAVKFVTGIEATGTGVRCQKAEG